MTKRDKMQKAVMGMLAVMMVTSLVLAVFAFAAPTPVAAIPCPGIVKHFVCWDCPCDGTICDKLECWRWEYYDNECDNWQTEYHCQSGPT